MNARELQALHNEVDACRVCRRGPRSNRDGWSDEEWDALWYVYPSTFPVTMYGVTFKRAAEVVPCEPHRIALENSVQEEEFVVQ